MNMLRTLLVRIVISVNVWYCADDLKLISNRQHKNFLFKLDSVKSEYLTLFNFIFTHFNVPIILLTSYNWYNRDNYHTTYIVSSSNESEKVFYEVCPFNPKKCIGKKITLTAIDNNQNWIFSSNFIII